GVGKTTLLQCLVWMRLVPSGDDPAVLAEQNPIIESLLRQGHDRELRMAATLTCGAALSSVIEDTKGEACSTVRSSVRIFFNAKRELSQEMHPESESTALEGKFPDPLVVAYGASRQRGLQNLASLNLLDPCAPSRLTRLTELYDVDELLGDLDHASLKKGASSPEQAQLIRLRDALAKILPGDEFKSGDIEILPPDVLESGEPSGVCLRTFSGLVPLAALRLGYQTTLAWTADLAWRLMKRFPESENPLAQPAIVMIDEIDLHLHPQWQLRIMDDLSEIFPATQFIATSHSPLMVQVGDTANLALVRKQEAEVEIVSKLKDVRRWRVDQILTSELFGVPGARNERTERFFARRDELALKAFRSEEEEKELEDLRIQIASFPTAADPEDQKAMELIREAAALLKKHNLVER
ncbi:MAG TPA: AAA family ATPase, partial [Pyrinomonadaceae bacterium]